LNPSIRIESLLATLLLPPAAAPLPLLCRFHHLHDCIFFAAFNYCSTTSSSLLLSPDEAPLHASSLLLSPVEAPLRLLCCFHLLQHHFLFSAAFTCNSTTMNIS